MPNFLQNDSNSPSADCHGARILLGDFVITVGVFQVKTQVNGYTISVSAPSPKYFPIELKDSTGQYNFQINQNGVFQNAQSLQPGTYIVYAAYIKQ